jgi:nicotinate-nucleotide pyrophosphorylase (carboxylating)
MIEAFLVEDLGRGDVTTAAIVPEGARARGSLLARSTTVVAGLDIAREVFLFLDPGLQWKDEVREGGEARPDQSLAALAGDARALLSAERVALNLLQRMCGIATATRAYVRAVEGISCRILDTRKTAPGLRFFDKRAVVAGGGTNHRFGLDDAVLVKDNHLAIAGSVAAAVALARRSAPAFMKIEVEVESERALFDALDAGADAILFDNRTPEELAALVAAARARRPGVTLEASGGITLDNVRAYAGTGVDFVSVGALTHSVRAADISLELEIA